jgi:hypothetical protein
MPIATGAIVEEVEACGTDSIPSLDRMTEAKLLFLLPARREDMPFAEIPVNAMLVLTDCVPIVATNPTTSVEVIPAGGVTFVKNDPFVSVTPESMLSVP